MGIPVRAASLDIWTGGLIISQWTSLPEETWLSAYSS